MQQHLKKHEGSIAAMNDKMNQFTDDSFFDKLENEKKIQEENNTKQQDIFKG